MQREGRERERERSLTALPRLPKIEASIMKIWDEACISLTTWRRGRLASCVYTRAHSTWLLLIRIKVRLFISRVCTAQGSTITHLTVVKENISTKWYANLQFTKRFPSKKKKKKKEIIKSNSINRRHRCSQSFSKLEASTENCQREVPILNKLGLIT